MKAVNVSDAFPRVIHVDPMAGHSRPTGVVLLCFNKYPIHPDMRAQPCTRAL